MVATKIVLPVIASLLALVAAAVYLVWKFRLRGRATFACQNSIFLQDALTGRGTSKGYILIVVSVSPTSKKGYPEESHGWILDHVTRTW